VEIEFRPGEEGDEMVQMEDKLIVPVVNQIQSSIQVTEGENRDPLYNLETTR
jgi:hypothetical protein